jgi:hypothetical protein
MTLDTLMHIVDDAYPDGFVWCYYTDPTTRGDTLAQFIMMEIRDTFDVDGTDVAQLNEAIRVMDTTVREVDNVITELELTLNKYNVVEKKED